MTTGNGIQNGVAELQLELANRRLIKVHGDDLVVQDLDAAAKPKTNSKKHTSADVQSVPLFNVLWAEAVKQKLILDLALPVSKSSFKLEKWTLEAAPEHAEALIPFTDALLSKAYGPSQQRKRAYVLINPHSGPGNGVKKWETVVKPMFEAAKMDMDVVVLSRGGEAIELVQTMDIDKYDTIIACSGDGTPHEIFNGLAKRSDAKKALGKLAVSHIPCGSGNAMACNLYGSHKPAFAALAIIKGIVTPLDLVSITQGDRRTMSFLSQSLGIVAESDLGTEHLRWMGSARFDLGMISRLFKRRVYPCDLALKVEVEEKLDIKEHYKRHASVPNLGHHPEAEQNGVDTGESQELPPLKYGTIQDDLPEGWELVSYDKIGNFYCGNMAYMAPDVLFFSAALASDGCMDLVTVNGDLYPHTALKAFLSVESNKFFDNPYVTYKKISAYRIIPRNQKDGYISIDGEKIPFEPFQAEIHQGLGRVISKRGAFEAAGPANWDKVTVKERLMA